MSDQRPSHAPRQKGDILAPLSVSSLLLGIVFLLGRVLFGADSGVVTEEETRRQTFLLVLGGYLAIQGVALFLLHTVRDPQLGEGVSGPLGERLRRAGMFGRLLLLPWLLLEQRRGRAFLNVALMVVLGATLTVLTNYVFARHELVRLDLTQERIYTLSDETVAQVRAAKQDVRLVVLMPRGSLQQLRQVQALVEQYAAASPRVEVVQHDPSIMAPLALEQLLAELELGSARSAQDLYGVVVQSGRRGVDGKWIKVQGKHIPLPELWREEHGQDMRQVRRTFLGERMVTAALREVTEEARPKIYFLTGHQEPSVADFDRSGLAQLAQLLRERNFEVETLDLLERERRDVPADARLLVVPGPRATLDATEVEAIRKYLADGGDAMFLMEPRRVRRDGQWGFVPTGLEELLDRTYGVRLDYRWVFLTTYDQAHGQLYAGPDDLLLPALDEQHKITAPLAGQRRIYMSTAQPVRTVPVLNVSATELVKTDPSWGERCFATADFAAIDQKRQPRTERGPFTMAAAVEVQEIVPPAPPPGVDPDAPPRRTRLVVFGDVEWAANQVIGLHTYGNLELFLNAVNWALERDERVVGSAPRPRSYRLEMTPRELASFKSAAVYGFPALALVLGIFAWVLRYRS